MITVEFAYGIGDKVRVKPTGRDGTVHALMHKDNGLNLVLVDQGTTHLPIGWWKEEQLERLPQ